MFNIEFKGKYTNENQIKKGDLPGNAVIFKEPTTITKAFVLGGVISLPFIIITFIGLIIKIDINSIKINVLIYSVILNLILMYFHEIIHALCFPKESKKEIWTKFNEGALFIYCNDQLSKKKFVWMCAAPNVILGFVPYVLFAIGVFDFNYNISNIIGITSWLMICSGIGDYLNIYNTMRQVPEHGKVFNYGIHSYWINENVPG